MKAQEIIKEIEKLKKDLQEAINYHYVDDFEIFQINQEIEKLQEMLTSATK